MWKIIHSISFRRWATKMRSPWLRSACPVVSRPLQIQSQRTWMRKDCWLGSLLSLWRQSPVLPSSQRGAAVAHPDSSQVLRWRQPLSLRKLLGSTEYLLHYYLFILQDTILTDSWSLELSLPPFCLLYTGLKNEPACSYSWHLKFGCVVFVVLLPVLRQTGKQGLCFWKRIPFKASFSGVEIIISSQGRMTVLWEKQRSVSQLWIDAAQNMYLDTSISSSFIKKSCFRP